MAKRKNRIQKIPDPSDATLLARMVYCGSCGRLMRRRRITYDYHEPTFCCVYDNEDLPEDKPCASYRYPVSILYQDVYAAIRKERRTALRTAKKLEGGVENTQYRLVKQVYQNRLFTVMEHLREITDQKNQLYMTLPVKADPPDGFEEQDKKLDAQAQKLTHRMARIADGFLEIHDLYTAKNKWLNLFSSIPEDFILTQELTRKTVKRITLLPGQPPIITFKQEDSKDLLFQKLNLVSRICREQSNQKEVSEHGE